MPPRPLPNELPRVPETPKPMTPPAITEGYTGGFRRISAGLVIRYTKSPGRIERESGLNARRKIGTRFVDAVAFGTIKEAVEALHLALHTEWSRAKQLHNLRRMQKIGIQLCELRAPGDANLPLESKFNGIRLSIGEAIDLVQSRAAEIRRSAFAGEVNFKRLPIVDLWPGWTRKSAAVSLRVRTQKFAGGDMKLLEAITSIKSAIDTSAEAKSDSAWKAAINAAGLVVQGDEKTGLYIDEEFVGSFGTFNVRVKHTCRDTSKTFSIGPDRTRVTLELIQDGKVVDSYTNGYED